MVSEPRLPSALRAVVAERRLLEILAYGLIGDREAAEHAVRATYARWYTMPPAARERVADPLSWLVTTLVRGCVVGPRRRGTCLCTGARRRRS
ncbi:sigma factor [Asanoa siamensis]|uniref:RNA polymerase sigma-70 region 2 domain-containing protein n=1 Tax=Asanoa siamensis TaxID=926357 RepID=A0ABQ4CRR4_9ACTN|nr:sigma factor [Asanoa siamensis]GIF73993.1 hypothetical protein Asi02nite_35110 [Asanoa siamensis]